METSSKPVSASWIESQVQNIRDEQAIRFEFHGKGREFFRIWVANLLLSIITLGIYSAWAKVRTKQYFYRSTSLDGAFFNYIADPVKILKGRSIVLVVVAVIYGISLIDPLYSTILTGSLSLLMPVFIHRSLKFNAHCSRYRNLRFSFRGTLREAFMISFLLPVLFGTSSAGLIAIAQQMEAYGSVELISTGTFITYAFFFVPYLLYRYKKYAVSHTWYGNSPLHFGTPYKEFCLLMAEFYAWIFFGLLFIDLVFPATFTLAWEIVLSGDPTGISAEEALQLAPLLTFASILPLFIYVLYNVRINNMVFNHTQVEGAELRSTFTIASYLRLCLTNGLILIFSGGLGWPLVRIRTAHYKARHTHMIVHKSLNHFVSHMGSNTGALGDAVGDYLDMDFGF